MKLDRNLQLDLLHKLSKAYPYYYDFSQELTYESEEYKKVVENLYYLQAQGLLEPNSVIQPMLIGKVQMPMKLGFTKLSHKGVDFVEDDGGIYSLLHMNLIKLEYEVLKDIFINKINSSELINDHKQMMIEAIEELPSDDLKNLVIKIIDTGYSNVDSLMKLIKTTVL